jgi:hypothetical protein
VRRCASTSDAPTFGVDARDAAQSSVAPGNRGGTFPIVTRISGGTEPGTFEFYVGIDEIDDLNYGVGAVILGLIETSGL